MKYATHCKFCRQPITVTIDDDYAKLGDALKLLEKACCNHCGDLRVERRHLEHKIALAVNRVLLAGKMDAEERQQHAEGLEKLLKHYAAMIARWHNKEGMVWDEEVVNALLDNPTKWGEIVGRLWRMFQSWQNQPEVWP